MKHLKQITSENEILCKAQHADHLNIGDKNFEFEFYTSVITS
jgi:hypothetical protein